MPHTRSYPLSALIHRFISRTEDLQVEPRHKWYVPHAGPGLGRTGSSVQVQFIVTVVSNSGSITCESCLVTF